MKKLIRALESVDFSNRSAANVVLGRIHADILFFAKRKDWKQLKAVNGTLSNYLSINETQNNNEVDQYVHKYFMQNLGQLIKLSEKIIWDAVRAQVKVRAIKEAERVKQEEALKQAYKDKLAARRKQNGSIR